MDYIKLGKDEEEEKLGILNKQNDFAYEFLDFAKCKGIEEILQKLQKSFGKITLELFIDSMCDILKLTTNSPKYPHSLESILKSYPKAKREYFLNKTIPFLVDLILHTNEIFPKDSLSLLIQRQNGMIKVSKLQCACLLSHMMFNTTIIQQGKNFDMPKSISFVELISSKNNKVKTEKLKCILCYFTTITTRVIDSKANISTEYLTFKRHFKPNNDPTLSLNSWLSNESPLQSLKYNEKDSMFDFKDTIIVDFADPYLGGLILKGGCVQEEIIFCIMPECIAGILLCEAMLPTEAIMIVGAERYCDYSGYVKTFRFEGEYNDTRGIDSLGRKDSWILAIDALRFTKDFYEQFKEENILRELNKAYIGFEMDEMKDDVRKSITTGRWGCGVFKGDSQLKFIIQWLACSKANKQMLFCGFGDEKLKNINEIIKKFEKTTTIGHLLDQVLKAKISDDV